MISLLWSVDALHQLRRLILAHSLLKSTCSCGRVKETPTPKRDGHLDTAVLEVKIMIGKPVFDPIPKKQGEYSPEVHLSLASL